MDFPFYPHRPPLPVGHTYSDLLTIIFVLVDDWYQEHSPKPLAGKPGAKPVFSDSEVITLILAQNYLPYPSETQDIGFLRANCTGRNIERSMIK
jgi:hypothetical protein